MWPKHVTHRHPCKRIYTSPRHRIPSKPNIDRRLLSAASWGQNKIAPWTVLSTGLSNYRKSNVHVASTRWKIRMQFQFQTLKGSANKRTHQNNVTMATKEIARWRRVLMIRWNGVLTESLGSIKGQEYNDYEKPIHASEEGLCRSVMRYLMW